MAGGLLELIANDSNLNVFITGDPQVTLFKRLYRRHSAFASESIKVNFNSQLNFGTGAELVLPPAGDLVSKVTLVIKIPAIRAAFLNSKAADLMGLLKSSGLFSEFIESRYAGGRTDDIEFANVMNYLDEKIIKYECEYCQSIQRIKLLRDFRDQIRADERSIPFFRREDQIDYDYSMFKHRLYKVIEDSALLSFLNDLFVLENILDTPTLRSDNLFNTLLYSDTFPRLFHSPEFLALDRLDLLENRDIYNDKITTYRSINDYLYSEKSLEEIDFRRTDIYFSRHERDVGDYFYNDVYEDLIGSYRAVLNVIENLATTIPISIIKVWRAGANYPVQIDPNYKTSFIISFNREVAVRNSYLKLINENIIRMFDTITRSFEQLFVTYSTLFTTNNLYYNSDSNITEVYGYDLLNLNSLYFYFFKYLNSLDPLAYTTYLSRDIFLTTEEILFMQNLISLMQKNVEYYMRDNAIYLKSMLNAKPHPAQQENTLLSTLIFYRGQIPSIQEMFEFMYEFIDKISIAEINKYQNVNIKQIDTARARQLVTLLYKSIYEFFRRVNNRVFGATDEEIISREYIDLLFSADTIFFRGRDQMEFYFSAESIIVDAINNFYYRILEDPIVQSSVGSNTYSLISLVNKYIQIQKQPYYKTVSIDRFRGKPYDKTEYIPRFYHTLVLPYDGEPIPRIPYGVPLDYFNNTTTTNTPIYLTPSRFAIINNIESITLGTDFYRLRNSLFSRNKKIHIHNVPPIEENLLKSLSLICVAPNRSSLQYIYDNIRDSSIKMILEPVINGPFPENKSRIISVLNELKHLYENHVPIVNDCIQYQPYSVCDLIKSNEETRMYINSMTEESSIRSIIQSMMDNFRSRYYYFVKIYPEINKLRSMNITSIQELSNYFDHHELCNMIFSSKVKKLRTLDESFQDIINTINHMVKINALITDSCLNDLMKFMRFINVKESMLIKMTRYLKDSPILISSTLAEIACEFGIDYCEFQTFSDNVIKRRTYVCMINEINSSLDYFILKYLYDRDVPRNITLKRYLNNILSKYGCKIPNKYIPIVIKTLLHYDVSTNPLNELCLSRIDLTDRIYHDFRKTKDLISRLIDSQFCFSNKMNIVFLKGYDSIQRKIESMIVEDRLELEAEITESRNGFRQSRRAEVLREQRINMLIDVLNRDEVPDVELITSNHRNESNYRRTDYFMDILDINTNILESVKESISERLIYSQERKRDYIFIKNQAQNIIYRNKDANCAWIKRLAHYLVKDITIRSGGEVLDINYSDWIEVFNQMTISPGQIPGYNKMIGDVKELTSFTTQTKESYTLYLPLIFWFNRNAALSLPLISNINTNISIDVSLRTINEVFYKEQYSSYISPITMQEMIPHIEDAYMYVEYIYLTMEERRIFVSTYLEYLIEEVQNDSVAVSARNTEPIFLVGKGTSTTNVLRNGVKTKEVYYDPTKAEYMSERHILQDSQLLDYYEIEFEKEYDRNGLIINTNCITNESIVHFRQLIYRNYFELPTKLMTVLIRMDKHIDPAMRVDDSEYFYGQREYDNFSLYSTFSHVQIIQIKRSYYACLKARLFDPYDPYYGMINIVNQILAQEFNEESNLPLEKIQILKDIWLQQIDYRPMANRIKMIENITALNLDFDITNRTELLTIIQNIYRDLNQSPPLNPTIIEIFSRFIDCFNLDDVTITKMTLKKAIVTLLHESVDIVILEKIINKHYLNHNHSVVMCLIDRILCDIPLESMKYHLKNTLIYIQCGMNDADINRILESIKDTCTNLTVRNLYFKEIIYSTIQDKYHWSPDEISIIAAEMNRVQNHLIDKERINVINYEDYLIPNPKVNPLVRGVLKFNGVQIMPISSGTVWNCLNPYYCLPNIPQTGVNLYSWSLHPACTGPWGSVNLSRMDDFTSVYDLRPEINDNNPATINTYVLSYNLWRVMSGMNGKAWAR